MKNIEFQQMIMNSETSLHFNEFNSSKRRNPAKPNTIIAKSLKIIKSSESLKTEHNSISI